MRVIKPGVFRKDMKKYMDSLRSSSDVIIVPREDEQAVVVMSLEEYNALSETGYLLSTEANRKRLAESMAELERGETIPFELD